MDITVFEKKAHARDTGSLLVSALSAKVMRVLFSCVKKRIAVRTLSGSQSQ
jgi:hypothetical protein